MPHLVTIEESKLKARDELEACDLLTLDGIRALKDNISSDKYAMLKNLIAEL